MNGHDHWDNSLFFWLEKDETEVASQQMSWTFIKQVCLGNEDEQVDGHAFPSLGVSWMPKTRSKCKERKRQDCASKAKRERQDCTRSAQGSNTLSLSVNLRQRKEQTVFSLETFKNLFLK